MKTSWFARHWINSGQWLASGNQCGDERRNGEGARNKRSPVLGRPKLQTVVGGTAVKAPMSTGVARHRVEQIVGLSRIGRFVGQLAGVTLLGKISVEQSREKFVRHDRLHAGAPDPDLAAPRMGGIDDRVGCNLGKIGGTGCGRRLILLRAQLNCGVLSAGIWTMTRFTSTPSCSNSVRRLSVNPRIANLAPQ